MLTFCNPNYRKVKEEMAHGFFPPLPLQEKKNGLAKKEGVIGKARKLVPGKISFTRDHI